MKHVERFGVLISFAIGGHARRYDDIPAFAANIDAESHEPAFAIGDRLVRTVFEHDVLAAARSVMGMGVLMAAVLRGEFSPILAAIDIARRLRRIGVDSPDS